MGDSSEGFRHMHDADRMLERLAGGELRGRGAIPEFRVIREEFLAMTLHVERGSVTPRQKPISTAPHSPCVCSAGPRSTSAAQTEATAARGMAREKIRPLP